MTFTTVQLNLLSSTALKAVKLASRYIQQFDHTQLTTAFKDCGSSLSSQVVTEVDLHCQTLIIEQLTTSCKQYNIALLSEENCADIAIEQHSRLTKDYFWCIDPLDGTLPFIEGLNGYAVSVSLVNNQGKPILAAIALPASNATYHIAFDECGNAVSYKNGVAVNANEANNPKELTFYCDRSFINSPQYPVLSELLTQLLATFNLRKLVVVSEHGAVVNALLALENSPACYIKLPKVQQGGGALWDFSGTASFAQTIGAWVSDMKGAPLALNQADSYYMNRKGVIYASDKRLGSAIVKRFNENAYSFL